MEDAAPAGNLPNRLPVIIFALLPFLARFHPPYGCPSGTAGQPLFNHLVINLRTSEGYKNFRDDILIWRTGEERKEIRYAPRDIPDMIRDIFGLDYDTDLLFQNTTALGSSV